MYVGVFVIFLHKNSLVAVVILTCKLERPAKNSLSLCF
nr:MAG TPA: hypothetical protein [Caudoviricetes sp.]